MTARVATAFDAKSHHKVISTGAIGSITQARNAEISPVLSGQRLSASAM
jgi:hypothetical protein